MAIVSSCVNKSCLMALQTLQHGTQLPETYPNKLSTLSILVPVLS